MTITFRFLAYHFLKIMCLRKLCQKKESEPLKHPLLKIKAPAKKFPGIAFQLVGLAFFTGHPIRSLSKVTNTVILHN